MPAKCHEISSFCNNEKATRITLCDFVVIKDRSSSVSDTDHQYLISLLKKKINSPKAVPFPINSYSKIEQVENLPAGYYSYEAKILYRYNAILLNGKNKFCLLDIETRKVERTIDFNVRGNCYHVEESPIDGQDYIYITSEYLHKYNLTKLIEGKSPEACKVWTAPHALRNAWGVATFRNDVYVCDYEKGLMRFDKRNGDFISLTPGLCMYGIAFTPENEMLLTYADQPDQRLELQVMDLNGEWIVKNEKKNLGSGIFTDPYSIFYEPTTQYYTA